MDSLVLYWVLTLVILVVLTLMTNIGIASVITTFIMVMKFISQSYSDKNTNHSCRMEGFETEKKIAPQTVEKQIPVKKLQPQVLPELKANVMAENAELLDDVLYPKSFSADDRIFDASVVSGYKDKKAKEIRSHWNNNNLKKYYDKEFGDHEERDWWSNDDFELSKKHVVI